MRTLRYVLPVAVFGLITVFLFLGLAPGRDPKAIPSPLINQPAPAFSLPKLEEPQVAWSPSRLHGRIWLLNVFASWCTPCLAEHPLLVELARDTGVPIIGLNYKDGRTAAQAWLSQHGNPYQDVVSDPTGRVAIDYGVYGVPETFLIDQSGVIRFKHVGPLTPEVIARSLAPKLKALNP